MDTAEPAGAAIAAAIPATAARAPPKGLLHGPELLTNGIAFSIHECPKAIRRELTLILPGVDVSDVGIIVSCQRAAMDLVNVGPDVAREKDALLENFAAWASRMVDSLTAGGHWGDYVDPCTGYAVRTPCSRVVFPEVDAVETLLRYRTFDAGGCKVVSHPVWGTAVYPASAFFRAPLGAVVAACRGAAAEGPPLHKL